MDNSTAPEKPAADQVVASAPFSPALVKDLAARWLSVRLYLETESAQAEPDLNGQLPETFIEAWKLYGASMLANADEQYTLFLEALNALPAHLMVPLIKLSAETELIPESFRTDVITKLALRKNHLPKAGLHG